MNDIVTTDFSAFGYREREEARDLLTASIEQGFPDEFLDEEVTIAFNRNSGFVFFTNVDYQACLLTDEGKLEMFNHCSYCGEEGFESEDIWFDSCTCKECAEEEGLTQEVE